MGEVSHAVLEAEHYKLWRENPLYRMECYLLDLEAERVPASIDLEEHSIIEAHTPLPVWTKSQERDIIQQLLADNEHLRKQWYEHLKEDREYRVKKKTRHYKYA